MDKKQYILGILQELRNDWPLAHGLISLVDSTEVSEKEIIALIEIFENVIMETKNTSLMKKLSTSAELLKNLQTREQEERKNEAEAMDTIFNHL